MHVAWTNVEWASHMTIRMTTYDRWSMINDRWRDGERHAPTVNAWRGSPPPLPKWRQSPMSWGSRTTRSETSANLRAATAPRKGSVRVPAFRLCQVFRFCRIMHKKDVLKILCGCVAMEYRKFSKPSMVSRQKPMLNSNLMNWQFVSLQGRMCQPGYGKDAQKCAKIHERNAQRNAHFEEKNTKQCAKSERITTKKITKVKKYL